MGGVEINAESEGVGSVERFKLPLRLVLLLARALALLIVSIRDKGGADAGADFNAVVFEAEEVSASEGWIMGDSPCVKYFMRNNSTINSATTAQ